MPIVAMVAIDLLDMAVLRLTLAPSQHHSLVRQERGRTIPLAVIGGRSAAKIQHPGDFTGACVAGGETCFGVPDPNSPIPKRICLPTFYREAMFLSPHFFDDIT